MAKLKVERQDDGTYTVMVYPTFPGEGRTQIETGVTREMLKKTQEDLLDKVRNASA